MSPELLGSERFGLEGSRPTRQSDCYALGMTIYEVLGGEVPFASNVDPVVIRKVLDGERPERPQGDKGKLFTGAIWGLLELCWRPQPSDRPSVKAVLLGLEANPLLISDPPKPVSGTFFVFHLEHWACV